MGIKSTPAPQLMMQFITAKWISKPIHVVAQLGIADMLTSGARHVDDLAAQCGARASSLYRILRALAGLGIFTEVEPRSFGLTPAAECLRSGEMRALALFLLSDWHERAWEKLSHTVVSGEVAFEDAHGLTAFDWLAEHPEEARIYNEANGIKAARTHDCLLDVCTFAGDETVVDVGGGTGALLLRILAKYPEVRGVVAETPVVIAQAERYIAERGYAARCRVEACDFLKAVPPQGDVYLLSNILHDWGDDDCVRVLRNCGADMMSGGRLLIVEMMLPEGERPSIAHLLDLEMLVMGRGRERTLQEYEELLERSGFVLSEVLPARDEIVVLVCTPTE
ncbi:MAG: methyltransferase [bacterium]|nr:methyltransferase [bacterium]